MSFVSATDLLGVRIKLYGHIFQLGLVLLFLFSQPKVPFRYLSVFIWVSPLVFVSIIFGYNSWFEIVKHALIFVSFATYFGFLYPSEIFKMLYKASVAHVTIALALSLIGIGVNRSYGDVERIFGLMSEPSAFAFAILFSFFGGYKYRNNFVILISSVSFFFSFSLTILISFLAIWYCIFLKRFPLLFSLIGFAAAYSLFVELDYVLSLISLFNERLASSIIFVFSTGSAGYNPRWAHIYAAIDFVSQSSNLVWFGLGFGSVEFFSSHAFNLPTYIFVSFGSIGVFVFLVLAVRAFAVSTLDNNFIPFTIIFAISVINGALGVLIFGYCLMFMFQTKKRMKR